MKLFFEKKVLKEAKKNRKKYLKIFTDTLYVQLENVILSVPFGTKTQMEKSGKMALYPEHEKLRVFEVAENNLPDKSAVLAARQIESLCRSLGRDDGLIGSFQNSENF